MSTTRHIVYKNLNSGGDYYAGPLENPESVLGNLLDFFREDTADAIAGGDDELAFNVLIVEMTEHELAAMKDA